LNEYTLTTLVGGEGSIESVPSGGTYAEGTSVELTAIPSSGWEFSHWTNGFQSVGDNPYTIEMTQDRQLKAVFILAPGAEHTLAVSITGEGIVVPGGGSYVHGASLILNAIAASGWEFSYWTDGSVQMTANPLPLTMNHAWEIEAVFTNEGSSEDPFATTGGDDGGLLGAPSDTTDGNNDGIVDSMQDNVKSFKTSDGQYYVTIESAPGTLLSDCVAIDKPSEAADLPSDGEYPYGFFAFVVEDVEIGGETTVTIYLPDDASPITYYKYGPEPGNSDAHWYEFMYDEGTNTGAKIDGNKITLYFVDGERGDDDLEANGTIVDDGGPGAEEEKTGCFISTTAFGFF